MMDTDVVLGKNRNDGRLIYFHSDEAILGQGRSGSGKSTSIAIPALFEFEGSVVALDIKEELFSITSGYRADIKSEVYKFNPGAEDGRSHRWNPFFAVDRNSLDRFDQIAIMANQLFPEIVGDGQDSANFWSGSARDAFTAAALLIAETPELPLTMTEVLRVFRRGKPGEWMSERIDARRKAGNKHPYSQAVVDGVEAFRINENDRLGNSIVKTVTTALQVWQNPRVCAATEETDFDIREIRRKNMTIYVTVAPGDVNRFAPLLRLFFDQVVGYNTRKLPRHDSSLKVPVLVLLDEFARLGRMPRVADSLQYARDYGLRYCILVQNRPQIMATYGPNAATDIWDNVGAECIFATGDKTLAEDLSARFGDMTMNVVTKTEPTWFAWANPSKQTDATHPHRRPVMLPAEIMQMPQNEMLIFRPGMPGAIAHKIRWWEEERFRSRVLPPPRIPELRVVIAMDDWQEKKEKADCGDAEGAEE